ncbi:hypothetical protein [Chitinophaga ginsengisoli]|uniref:Uncharacterized protein n=1 Tax=Chitinophaga ginsengisoli TaxID=363837 RepID=A0A2P8FXK2_9BACT|nr:hypothetical protein [Chitinophaga ginsengisoli]PSL26450.1 hypothetical protein CLV42_111164 [Chitinophaga ginsengisoli]
MTARIDRETESFQNILQEELVNITNQYFDNERKAVLDERKQVEEAYNQKIAEYKRAINTLKENNAVEQFSALEKDLEMTVKEYEQSLKVFDDKLTEIAMLQTQVLAYMKISPAA